MQKLLVKFGELKLRAFGFLVKIHKSGEGDKGGFKVIPTVKHIGECHIILNLPTGIDNLCLKRGPRHSSLPSTPAKGPRHPGRGVTTP